MYKIGVVPGKFFPPHRGHLYQIINASTLCEHVYVVVSDSEPLAKKLCKKDNLPFIDVKTRARWLSIETKDMENITVLHMYEDTIPAYPYGSAQWTEMLTELVPDSIDVIFGGEPEYEQTYMKYLPNIKYYLFDYKRSAYSISGTRIRSNYLENWHYILGVARPFFSKKVLITGTESCGKTTLTKNLGKIYNTSWSEEYGRYYSKDYMGGNEKVFDVLDFHKIAQIQAIQDEKALRTANKVVFFDTDCVVTQYYCIMYTGYENKIVESMIDPNFYDLIILIPPSVPWVDDGFRYKGDTAERYRLHYMLKNMYIARGFHNIVELQESNYNGIMQETMSHVNGLGEGR